MFQHLKNIETAFKHIRLFTAVLTIAYAMTTCYALYWTYNYAMKKDKQIWVVVNGKALPAMATDQKENIPVEARDHIKAFHQLFFTLIPDDDIITSNVRQALYLADRSAKEAYDNLKENGFYTQVVNANISQQLQTDSITVDMNT